MKKKYTWKSILASILVTVALAAPIVVISSANDPHEAELIFEVEQKGGLVFHADGTVQLLVNVAVDKVINGRGATFNIKYNPDYLTPSYIEDTVDRDGVSHKVNEALEPRGAEDQDGFFREDKGLLGGLTDSQGKPVRAISKYSSYFNANWENGPLGWITEYYSHVDVANNAIDMDLWFDDEAIHAALDGKPGAGKLLRLRNYSHDPDDAHYVINKRDEGKDDEGHFADNPPVEKVVLGQLSFQVNKDRLAEMIALFGTKKFTGDGFVCFYGYPANPPDRPEATLAGKQVSLIDINFEAVALNEDPWQVGFYSGTANDRGPEFYTPATSRGTTSKNIAERYIYNFDRDLIVDVQLTDPDFEINAYQNHTNGVGRQGAVPGDDKGDLAVSMTRYAGMVTVTYADGRKENQPFPWTGKADQDNKYTQQYIKKADLDDGQQKGLAWRDMKTSPIDDYDPTANEANPGVGTDYIFTQLYQTYKTDNNGNYIKNAAGAYEVDYTFPIPVVGHMRVTPIKVIDVTAEDLTRTYLVSAVTEYGQVQNVGDLALPSQARIITDIVPGPVSLVTPIKGWKPVQPTAWVQGTQEVSTWPTTSMHSLKAEQYTDANAYPYWPDVADRSATQNPATQGNFIGDYYFQTSEATHTTAQGILKVDILASFPWLTVPKDEYDLEKALRRIVGSDRYADPDDYKVEYVSTVTESILDGTGQTRQTDQPALTLSVSKITGDQTMKSDSVFRVWLPNGLELGTGQNRGGKSAVDWFQDAGLPEAHGYYDTQAVNPSAQRYFHLITNPADPALPESPTAADEYYNGSRETLRRYINLGGWYYVAICENPDDQEPVWTDPIPVYVPPRPNEYQESKLYNFVAENQGLFNWPGGVSATMAFPRGEYDTLAPDLHGTGNDSLNYLGLPVYEVLDSTGNVTSITTGEADPTDIYEGGNPYRIQENVRRHSESYGVETTYDGQTGAQPGTIFNVRVDDGDATDNGVTDQAWNPHKLRATTLEKLHTSVEPADPYEIYRHGETALQNDYRVTGFGTVYQPGGKATQTYPADPYTATLRHQLPEEPPRPVGIEKITLTSEVNEGITRVVNGDKKSNVTLVTFNTAQVGYTIREEHLLYINNVGDVDIYGLDIDSIVDGYDLDDPTNGQGGHFEITMAPASFLPAGASTPFILTYVYNLPTNAAGEMRYRDTLYITSTSHPTADPSGTPGDEYLLDFDAEFTVSRNALHKVTVIYRPTDGSMGTAGIIVGEEGSGANVTMNSTTATSTYPQNAKVYVEARLVDEYEVYACYADGTGVSVLPYSGTATLADGTKVYVFNMPNRDVTIYVDFYEPIRSKLRLGGLIEFSAPKTDDPSDLDLVQGYDSTGVYEPTDKADHIYKVWKKKFTSQDYTDAAAWKAGVGVSYDQGFYLMTTGSAIPKTQNGDVYESSSEQYLVVIENEDDFSQLKATLRAVEHHVDWKGTLITDPTDPNYDPTAGYNNDIKPRVNMEVYYDDDVNGHQVRDKWGGISTKVVYNIDHGYGPYDDVTDPTNPINLRPDGDTAKKTQHISGNFTASRYPNYAAFESPEPGKSAYVRITVSYQDTAGDYGAPNTTYYRYYYVEIHRPEGKPEIIPHYGNSPYGMIMNDSTKFPTKTTQDAAKDAFVSAGYTFRGAKPAVLPTAAQNKLQSVTYWREAWVRNKGLFEPESLTGFHQATDKNGKPIYQDSSGKTVTVNTDGSLPADIKGVFVPNADVYTDDNNLDLNDYAFFAILGQEIWEPGIISAKDSSGRTVDPHEIHARMMDMDGKTGVTLLDESATKQVERFSGTEKAIIDLGVAGQKLKPATGTVTGHPTLGVTQWPVRTTVTTDPTDPNGAEITTYDIVENIRPGRYIIEYSYYDFDGVSLLTATRPLVILRKVGDVNVDGVRDSVDNPAAGHTSGGNDEYAIEDRVTNDPLGYEAGGWSGGKETTYPHANIFKFRVADVNNDRNINNIDANQVAANVKKDKAKLDENNWLRFYDPLDYGHPVGPNSPIGP